VEITLVAVVEQAIQLLERLLMAVAQGQLETVMGLLAHQTQAVVAVVQEILVVVEEMVEMAQMAL
jgi:hypothetical protein